MPKKKKMKKPFLVFCFTISMFFLCPLSYAQEQITITTYYPAPVGVYTELRAQRLALGATYFNPSVNVWETAAGVPVGATIGVNADLVVEGRVGIGTMKPLTQVEIRGGDVNIPVNQLGFNSGVRAGTRGIANTDAGWIYGEHDANTETSRLIIEIRDGSNDQIRFRSVRWDAPLADVLTINGDGNVGIGTTSPTALLDVRGSSNTCIRVDYDANSGVKNCPPTYYMTMPLNLQTMNLKDSLSGDCTIEPILPGFFICCKACSDDSVTPDGICG